jgi:hypothetical protein
MKEMGYEDRLEAAYQEGRAAAMSGSDVSRFTPGTPMYDAWQEGRAEGLEDSGWQQLGMVVKRVVRRLRVGDGE